MNCSPPGSSVHEFSRQDYWSGLPFPPPRIFPIQELNLRLLHWQVDSLLLSHQGSPLKVFWGRKLEGFLKAALIWIEEEECCPVSPGEQNQDLRRSCLLLNDANLGKEPGALGSV